MELININRDNYFDSTPKLKSSPKPISFIPFNNEKLRCNVCGTKYSVTLMRKQKYCNKCLSSYIKNITDNNLYLDVHIRTNNTQCIKHKTSRNSDFYTHKIQEWCENCSEISYFNQIISDSFYISYEEDKTIKTCKLCEKLIYNSSRQKCFVKFKLCSDCYLISSGWIKSTLTRKSIPIIYLPWWDIKDRCVACDSILNFISDCQKWCSYCFTIYTVCRYCLTTNITFGITDQSQCKKCKRISIISIDITNINSGNIIIEDFLASTRISINNHYKIANYMNIRNKHFNPLNIYGFIRYNFKLDYNSLKPAMRWIPYSQITNLKQIAVGGFGIVYKANWFMNKTVAIKRFFDSRDVNKYFLHELESLLQCYDLACIIKYYGITQDPITKEYMLIMNYANGGDLHNYLQRNFTSITWEKKLEILCRISNGLKSIHDKNFVHRDFHSGNILSINEGWYIGDLGLSQLEDSAPNKTIYGAIPYIAPEIFRGVAFSKESDIYSMGMIMWELTTGCKPFDNVEHDHDTDLIFDIIDGNRPEITNDTPICFANLMKRCWDSDPLKRPSVDELCKLLKLWYFFNRCGFNERFNQAEKRRLELVKLKKLGPEFTKRTRAKAIYTSRQMMIKSKTSSSPPLISFNMKKEYVSKEYELDINSNNNVYSDSRYFVISSMNVSVKRNFEELDIETHDTNKVSKHVKR